MTTLSDAWNGGGGCLTYMTQSRSLEAVPRRRSEPTTQMRFIPHRAFSGSVLQHQGREVGSEAGAGPSVGLSSATTR